MLIQTAALRPDQIAKLDRLKNRRALYEIEIVRVDGVRALLCYSDATSQTAIKKAIRERSSEVIDFLGASVGLTIEWDRSFGGFRLSDGSTVRRTGRTKRDAIIEDRFLPYVGKMCAASN